MIRFTHYVPVTLVYHQANEHVDGSGKETSDDAHTRKVLSTCAT